MVCTFLHKAVVELILVLYGVMTIFSLVIAQKANAILTFIIVQETTSMQYIQEA